MLKEILKLWREEEQKGLVGDALGQFEEMLKKGKHLYLHVTDALFLGGDLPELKEDVYAQDSRINQLEQLIRRKIITALTANPSPANVTASLILMSVVKDAERIGDYGKNIFEVFQKISKLEEGPYHDRILNIRNAILESFDHVKQAFRTSDSALAKKLLASMDDAKKQCDQIVDELLVQQQTKNAVAYALLSRFFKRTLGHLSNIITSIIMPLDKLDYFDEDHLDELEAMLKKDPA